MYIIDAVLYISRLLIHASINEHSKRLMLFVPTEYFDIINDSDDFSYVGLNEDGYFIALTNCKKDFTINKSYRTHGKIFIDYGQYDTFKID